MKRPTLQEVMRSMTRFVVLTFVVCGLLGLAASVAYYQYSKSPERLFHSLLIFAALGYTCPMFGISVRLMIRMFYMSCEGMENTDKLIEGYDKAQAALAPMTENLKIIIDKARPIADNIDVIIQKAKAMADDIERVAHKVRGAMESMNGHLDFKNLGDKLDRVGDNLSTIAQAFGGGSSEPAMPEIDFLKPSEKKTKRA